MSSLRLAVVLSGRFQPFHCGHHAAFLSLGQRFGTENVWLGTSDRAAATVGRPAPFDFAEKRAIITRLFGVPEERVVCIRSPYGPREILGALDPERTAYVAALGARDAGRLKSRYWAPLMEGEALEPYPKRGYYIELPAMAEDLSASTVRQTLGSPELGRDEKVAAFRAWYPYYDAEIFEMILERLTPAAAGGPLP